MKKIRIKTENIDISMDVDDWDDVISIHQIIDIAYRELKPPCPTFIPDCFLDKDLIRE